MAMGTCKKRNRHEGMWIPHTELAKATSHPFYQRLNELLEAEQFDEFFEGRCAKFYAKTYGRPSLTPGIYFRSLLIGSFEDIDSERGIAWRIADSLGLRGFAGIALDEDTPDHSTISRTRRLKDLETHREVFAWILGVLADRGLVKGKRIGIDATTLEANAAMRSIIRRDIGSVMRSFCAGWPKRRAWRRRRGRTWSGFHHHATLSITVYGFLVLERRLFPPSDDSRSIKAANIQLQLSRVQSDYVPRGATRYEQKDIILNPLPPCAVRSQPTSPARRPGALVVFMPSCNTVVLGCSPRLRRLLGMNQGHRD